MTADWTPLDLELRTWQDQGLTLPLWWRDDDADSPTPQLDQLAALSQTLQLPVHLAIVPRDTTEALAKSVALKSQLIPVLHGWAHQTHAPQDEAKNEYGTHRPLEVVLAEATRGFSHLRDLFGDALQPMFVPPWNRIAPEVVQGLPGLGFTSLSTFKRRKSSIAADGMVQINTHVDPINWRVDGSLVPAQRLLDQITQDLNARRLDGVDPFEPYGILTHHRVHDDAIWGFTEALISRLLAGPAQPWTIDGRETLS